MSQILGFPASSVLQNMIEWEEELHLHLHFSRNEPMSPIALITPILPGLYRAGEQHRGDVIVITARATALRRVLSHCQQHSARVHSYYRRSPYGFAIQWEAGALLAYPRCAGSAVPNPTCQRKTFAEPLPLLVSTSCATHALRCKSGTHVIGEVVGGEAGARLSSATGDGVQPRDNLAPVVRRALLPASSSRSRGWG